MSLSKLTTRKIKALCLEEKKAAKVKRFLFVRAGEQADRDRTEDEFSGLQCTRRSLPSTLPSLHQRSAFAKARSAFVPAVSPAFDTAVSWPRPATRAAQTRPRVGVRHARWQQRVEL